MKKNNYEYIYLNKTTSTMDEAKKILKDNLSNKNYIIRANQQLKGIGRRGNEWISPNGNLYCTFAIKTNIPIKDFYLFSIIMSLSIKKSLEYIGIKNIFFKWPNDIYIEDQKISGMILDSFELKNDLRYSILGLGLNYSSSPNLKNYKTTHVLKYKANFNLEEYFLILINYFFNNLISIKSKSKNFYNLFKNSLMFLGEEIKIKVNENRIIMGKFIDLNNDGSLLIFENNRSISIYSGQIIL